MPKIKQSPKKPPEQRRGELLEAARKLFVKKGYRGATTEEIARGAGLTKGALYFHFKNKEDILYELIRLHSKGTMAILEEQISGQVTPSQMFEIMLNIRFGKDASEYQDLVDIFVQAWRIPRIKRYINRHMRQVVSLMADHINPEVCHDRAVLEDLAVLALSMKDGLSAINIMVPSLVNLERQSKLIGVVLESYCELHANAGNKK